MKPKIIYIIIGLILYVVVSIFVINPAKKKVPELDITATVRAPIETISPRKLLPHNVIENDETLVKLWSLSDVFTGPYSIGPRIAAAEGRVFLLGNLAQTGNLAVVALDGSNGTLVWRDDPIRQSLSTLYATPSVLYVGSLGNTRIIAYDLLTGQTLWSKRVRGDRGVRNIYATDDIVYVNSSARYFHLLRADTGKVIETFTQFPTTVTLQEVEKDLSRSISTLQIRPEYFEGSTFTDGIMFVRSAGREPGIVRAIDRETGNTLWETERNVISNVVTTKSVAYLLTLEGKLLGVDVLTGEVVTSVQFGPSPFVLYNPGAQPDGYYVAADEDADLLYAYLGDSKQLFAFKIDDYADR